MMRAERAVFFTSVLLLGLFVSCRQKQPADTLFKSMPSTSTHINFANTPVEKKAFGILYYLYYFNGGGVSAGDINNDGLTDLYFTANNQSGNKLYLNKGNFEFEDITAKAGVAGTSEWCTGATMADINGDGWLDIYVSAVNIKGKLAGRNELFINKGDGTFTEMAAAYGLDFSGFTTQAAFFDYDRDGDLDCYILNQSHKANENIVDTINRRKIDPEAGDRLMRNELNTGKAVFTDVSAAAGIYQSNLGYGLGIAVGDLNNDGWDDIFIGNDFHENDYYYINNGDGSFKESGAAHFGHYSRFSMGNDIADYNNDGQLDVITADMLPSEEKVLKTYGSDENPDIYQFKLINNGFQYQYSKNCLHRNNGDGTSFSETALLSGVAATDWSWAPLFADFDNDGNKDLLMTSGILKRPVDLDYIRFVSNLSTRKALSKTDQLDNLALEKIPDGASHPYFFRGDGKEKFVEVTEAWGTIGMKGYYNGAAYADLDNDGRLDVVINCIGSPALVLKNNAPLKKQLTISFEGEGNNRGAIGARAYLYTAAGLQYQQLMPTRGFQSSSVHQLHIGMGNEEQADSLLIVWPGPGRQYQLIKNVKAGKLLVKQSDAANNFNYRQFFPQVVPMMEDITERIASNWKHREDNFNDFNVQYLLPHAQSTRGPRIAVGDINRDGLDDYYAVGAKGQPGVLFVQTAQGKFVPRDETVFAPAAASEEVAAVFFDANKDGHVDLYVVAGGNEYADGHPALSDRLYLNDGKGHFSIAINSIPELRTNKSCVAAADIDQDGDIDLFVGGLANATRYGYAQPSFLLLNDGSGHFEKAAQERIPLQQAGMVTTAAFADINSDGWPDLVMTGEWLPVKIFINNKGVFTPTEIPASSGLWQTLYPADVNGDGKMDLLAGNWGHNNKLYSGKNGPAKLYVKDFDNNGTVEQVMAYTLNGEEYPFLAKDELERAMPVLKKAYLTYTEVAGKTVQYMFYDLFKDYIELKAEVLGSSCFINDGKGSFKRQDLPAGLQLGPVFSFSTHTYNNRPCWLAAGNFYGVVPYEGRYDAQVPAWFSFDSSSQSFKVIQQMASVSGENRDQQWLRTVKGQSMLVMAANNRALQFFTPLNKKQ